MNGYKGISIVDLAYEVITMSNENEFLKAELDHYKKLYELHCASIKESDKHVKETTAKILVDNANILPKGNADGMSE